LVVNAGVTGSRGRVVVANRDARAQNAAVGDQRISFAAENDRVGELLVGQITPLVRWSQQQRGCFAEGSRLSANNGVGFAQNGVVGE
jgi:hypothetical protein